MTLIEELRKESTGLKGTIIIHIDFITQAINEGYTKRKIFDFLIKKNLLKTDYSYFVKVLNNILIESNFKQEIVLNKSESIRPKKFKMVDIKDSDFE